MRNAPGPSPATVSLGTMNKLHLAAHDGSIERTLAALSTGVIGIDESGPRGFTSVMYASFKGHSRVVRILLNKGANATLGDENGLTALHMSSAAGHLAVMKLLVKAGADVETKASDGDVNIGCRPLHLAVEEGQLGAMRVLIEAGANPDSLRSDGFTSLFIVAGIGNVDATKILLRARADPLLAHSHSSGGKWVPLDAAAQRGHLGVARELIQEHGIEGCGGTSGGVYALAKAAGTQHLEMVRMLTSAGVVDTGRALLTAANYGRESSVRFLLQQQEEWKSSGQGGGYLDTCDPSGRTPMLCSIQAGRSCSPRITRLLVDAGADALTAVRWTKGLDKKGGVISITPLALVDLCLRDKKIRGKDATESQLHSLEANRRLLMRVDAVHAVSWLWASDVPSVTHAAAESTVKTKAISTSLMLMLPILRRRTGRPRILLAALSRHSGKPY